LTAQRELNGTLNERKTLHLCIHLPAFLPKQNDVELEIVPTGRSL
jgi:hypothetical protein